jgi:prepilin-type N-terminal cleavage/methylation domain-containing protein
MRRGFTLIELVVVTGLISGIAFVVSVFLVTSLKTYRLNSQSSQLENNTASVMREFEFSTRAATQVLTAQKDELKFYRFYDLTSISPKQIRYFVDGNVFKVGVTEPVGTPPSVTYPADNEKIDLLVEDVTNPSSIFNYFDGSGTELIEPVNTANIKMVGITISLDKDVNLPPEAITQETKVTLRNLKNNL